MTTAPNDPPFASARVDSDGRVVVHYSRCWACMLAQHPGGPHGWADTEDVAHAAATGLPDPSGQSCGCWCVKQGPVNDEPPDVDPVVPLDSSPCEVCGEAGACAYDAEGRPMIHVTEETP